MAQSEIRVERREDKIWIKNLTDKPVTITIEGVNGTFGSVEMRIEPREDKAMCVIVV